FFFQAEDGIRDYKVTGVQTCALPISLSAVIGREHSSSVVIDAVLASRCGRMVRLVHSIELVREIMESGHGAAPLARLILNERARSEERRVGKERRGWVSYAWWIRRTR